MGKTRTPLSHGATGSTGTWITGSGYEKGQRIAAPPRSTGRANPGPFQRPGEPGQGASYAATLILSAATAMRFEIGCATSPASFSDASVDFEVCAIIASNAERA